MVAKMMANRFRARVGRSVALGSLLALAAMAPATLAFGEIALDRVIVDLGAGEAPREDIEIHNVGERREFVVVEPMRVLRPGTDNERRVSDRDPERLGLLVSPNRLVLEPGQRKLIRLAVLKPASDVDAIYRVTVRPVAGKIKSDQTAIKVLFGYNVLVIVRPPDALPKIEATRRERAITFTNSGNTNALLHQGRQCDEAGENCADLPARRLYAESSWKLALPYDTPVEYYVESARSTSVRRF